MVGLHGMVMQWTVEVDFSEYKFIRNDQADCGMYTVSQKKFPPLNSLQVYQILTDFQNFFITGKHVQFATKPIRQY